jgi:hypothetical protein
LSVQEFNYQALSGRLMRLARLDTSVFEEVRLDASATIPSLVVAVVATFLAGLGGWLYWMIAVDIGGGSGDVLIKSAILGTVFSVALWLAWVFVVYAMLTQVFKAQADVQQLVRTMGMAAAPLALSVLMFIPEISFAIALASVVMFYGLTTLAILVTTNAPPAQVMVANLAGFAVWAIVLTVLAGDISGSIHGISVNVYAPGIFLFGNGYG